ncbi:START domain-containing protein [Roseateles sp.]|uniref:START domain-containing protein n=1 Tax=Roseateles sp. TaxID=1971397 RepID=UPI0039E901F3
MNIMRSSIAVLIAAGLFAGNSASAQDAWNLAKDADGIQVYVRSVADSPLREFRGEVQVRAKLEHVVLALRDAGAFRKWMPDVITSDLLKSSDTEQYHYLENKAPWPVSNRDGVYRFGYSRPADGVVVVSVEAVPNLVPLREGRVRIPLAEGQWRLVSNADGVGVSYQMHASPGGAIPSWLANQAVVDTPYGTLKALRARVQADH